MEQKSGTSRSEPATKAPLTSGSVSVAIDRHVVRIRKSGKASFAPGVLNVLMDGRALAQVSLARASSRLAFTLPPNILPLTIDLVDAATAKSVLGAPLSLEAALAPRVDRARIAKGQFLVTISMDGHPVERLPVAVVDDRNVAVAGGMLETVEDRNDGRSHFAASLPLLRLLANDYKTPLTLYVGGRRMVEPVPVSPQAIGFAGYIDQSVGDGIQGWAVDLARPKRPVRLDVLVGERHLATVNANETRPDLIAGKDAVARAFTVGKALLGALEPGDLVSVVLAGTRTHLVNSPRLVQAGDTIRGIFDNIDGNQACGWVIDLSEPDKPCTVEAICEGRVIGTVLANGLRRDVLEAGLPTDRCGFRISFVEPLHTLLGRDIIVRIKENGVILNGGPRKPEINPNIKTYLTPDRGIAPPVLDRLRRYMNRRAAGMGLSIVMPVYNTRREWLTEALRSVCTQWCGAWELICIDDASSEPHVAAMLAWFAQTDPRIRVIRAPRNEGVAAATTRGIMAARHPYTALMDHDDVLEPDAVHHMLTTARKTGADLIYSDEVLTAEDSAVVLDVRGRPAFSHDYYLSHPYFVHMVAVRTEIAQRIGGFDAALAISADVDFILRAIEESRGIAHIPRVLYRWRTHATSTGHEKQGQVMASTTAAIQRHLDRLNTGAQVKPAVEFNQFEITWPDPGGRVLIVIPTKDGIDMLAQCIASIEATVPADEYRIVVIDHESVEARSKTYLAQIAKRHAVIPYRGPFNYAEMNNLAIRVHGHNEPFVLLMNNDIEAVGPGWLQRMRSLAARPDVGAAGTALMYSDKRMQHAGVIVGINGLADHALRFEPVWQQDGSRNLGYNASLTAVRDFSAVTAACMMMRRSVFDQVGGFSEKYAVGFNDTDLCLRISQTGLKLLYDGRTVLFHHESVTRIARAELKHPKDDAHFRRDWKDILACGDPYYSPLLELYGADHKLRLGACAALAPRTVTVSLGRSARKVQGSQRNTRSKRGSGARVRPVAAD